MIYLEMKSLKNSILTVINQFYRLEKRLEEIYSSIKNMSQNQSKYNLSNASKVQIIENINSPIGNQNISQNNTENVEIFLEELQEFKKIMENLQEKYDNVNDSQAITIRDRKLREIERNQPERWKKFLQLKRLWKGIKGGAIKLGEHFAEDTPWGKAAIGFIEAVSDDID
ncbi:MAG: hypothetical protein QNJ64_00240 [Crocosphaera sp.]|nr:hypothetical protein [Crocosphaera sp.]